MQWRSQAPRPVQPVVAEPVVAKPVAAKPVAAPPPPPTPQVVTDAVKDRLLALVAEKTGYPLDMLDLDLDLEADLGVDTVKQADLFASIRESTVFRATRIASCATFPRWRM